ncbi:MAG: methyltransferase domain-containing protein [Candidatus Woesearchaeota archaeon]
MQYTFKDANGKQFYTFTFEKGLNLGSGPHPLTGFVNVDYYFPADVRHDLNKFPYPFKDESFDFILASAIMEHLDDDIAFLKECHRLLKKRGKILISVPHQFSAWRTNPEHKRSYTWQWFDYFVKPTKEALDIKKDFVFSRIIKRKFEFYWKKQFWNRFFSLICNKYPLFYESSFLRSFPCNHVFCIYEK